MGQLNDAGAVAAGTVIDHDYFDVLACFCVCKGLAVRTAQEKVHGLLFPGKVPHRVLYRLVGSGPQGGFAFSLHDVCKHVPATESAKTLAETIKAARPASGLKLVLPRAGTGGIGGTPELCKLFYYAATDLPDPV